MRFSVAVPRLAPVWGLIAAVGLMTACSSETKPSAFPTVGSVFSRMSTLDGSVVASLRQGDAPAATGGPSASLDGINVGINGGSLPMTITSATPFQRVILAVDGLDDYFELNLPSAVTSVDVVASIRTDANPTDNLPMRYGLSDGSGQGSYASHGTRILRVATGDVQVSVAWDSPTDVDLRVVDPFDEEVYFGNLQAQSGGFLDLDSNPACNIDGINNENIVWPAGGAPTGSYKVRLDYWDDCGQGETNWVVTIQSAGQAPQIFSGKFTGFAGGGVDIDSLASIVR